MSVSDILKREIVSYNLTMMCGVYYLKDERLLDYAITTCTPEGLLAPTDFHLAK